MTIITLSDAITAAEQSQQVFQNSATQTASDQAAVAGIQSKLDAANATVDTDLQAQDTAAKAFNDSLETLIAAATAAKIPGTSVIPAGTEA